MNRLISRIIFVLLTLSLTSGLATAATTKGLDTIVAVVNGSAITNSQLNDQIKITMQQKQAAHEKIPPQALFRKQVLDRLIDTELQLQVAKRTGIHVDDAMVNAAIGRIAAQNGLTVAELQAELQKQGMNYDRYRKEIHNQIVISQVHDRGIAPKVKVSEQEVTDFLANHGRELNAAPQQESATGVYRVHAIVIPVAEAATEEQIANAKKAAEKALAQLKSGVSPEQLASSKLGIEYNIEQNDLGWRPLAQLPDLYISHVQHLASGSFAGPLRAPNGFHVLKLIGTQGAQAPRNQSFAETHVRHILIKTTPLETDSQVKVILERLRANILGGEDFAKAATENSQDPGSVHKGGDLGWMTSGELDPTFEEVMNKTNPGQISQPFKSHFGWHILQVLGRKPIKDQQLLRRHRAKELVFQQKFNKELEHWLKKLRQTEYVRIMDQQS